MANKSTIVRFIQTAAPVVSRIHPPLAGRWLARLFTTPTLHPTPDREQAWIASARAGRIRFDATRTLPTLTWGNDDAPTVLLVHGWSGRGSQLGAWARPLVDAGYRVVAFDHPAHGRADGRATAMPEFAEAVVRVAASVGQLHGIVAHSLGAAATTAALARGVRAERLVYVAPPEDLPNYLARAGRWLGFGRRASAMARRAIEFEYDMPFDQVRGRSLAPDRTTPLLIVHDEGDRDVPFDEGAHIARLWPGARLVATQGLGHTRILRDASVIQTGVAFLVDGSAMPAHTASPSDASIAV